MAIVVARRWKEGEALKIQESAENYLEMILKLKGQIGQVRSIDVVHAMGFSKPSVSYAMKQFRENGYVEVDGDGFIALTDKGMDIACRVLERHTVLERFLTELGVDKTVAVDDACKMEHDISEQSFDAIKKWLAARDGEPVEKRY